MSRLGKTAIKLPKGIEVKVVGNEVHVKGPKGNLNCKLDDGFSLQVDADKVFILKDEKKEIPDSFHGLFRSLVSNMIEGVSKGYERKLTLIGVGYRAAVQGQNLDLQLGFSHPTQVRIPKHINVVVDKSTTIVSQVLISRL